MKRLVLHIFLVLSAALLCLDANAQFRNEAFTQNNYDDQTSPSDTASAPMFSIKDYWKGIRHKDEMKIGTSFAGSVVLIGGQQIYNRDYWKLPIVYGGLAATVGGGFALRSKGNTSAANWCFAGAGLVYWGTLMDGVVNYSPGDYPHPGKATLYSVLCPGLGQVYNHELWKTPIYIGGMMAAGHFYALFRGNYQRYRDIYNDIAAGNNVAGISSNTALYYRNLYRRYRDYSLLAFVAVYILQAVDANVFAYMHDFEVTDDLAISISPTIITPDTEIAFTPRNNSAFGMSFGIRF